MTLRRTVYLALLLTMGLLLSFKATDNKKSEGTSKGDLILTEGNGNESIEKAIENSKGKYIILNFWSCSDAESHARNLMLGDIVKDKSDVVMISVSFDRSSSVYYETVKSEALRNTANILVKEGFESKTAKSYGVEEFGNFVIDKKGVIIKKNADIEDIKAMFD